MNYDRYKKKTGKKGRQQSRQIVPIIEFLLRMWSECRNKFDMIWDSHWHWSVLYMIILTDNYYPKMYDSL